jgi:hypothetical protein
MTTILSFLPVLSSVSLPLAEFNNLGIGPFLIPLAAIGLGLAGIIFGSLEKMQKRRLRHELLRVALEKGQPLPAELLDEPQERRNRDDRRSGMIALAVGAALYFFLGALVPDPGVKWVALIPGFTGLALLLNWALERHADNGQKLS